MESQTNASQGAAFLTHVMPGWEDRVDLSRLNMVSETDCVAGQLYDGYVNALYSLFPGMRATDKHAVAVRFGFDLPDWEGEYNPEERETQWTRLREEWTHIITDLRSK